MELSHLFARAIFLVEYIAMGLMVVVGLLWSVGWLSRQSARRERSALDTLNSVMVATVQRRSLKETMGKVLEQTVEGLGASSGCIHLADGEGRYLKLLHAVGVQWFDWLAQVPLDDPLAVHLADTTDAVMFGEPNPTGPWATLSSGPGLTLVGLRLGGQTRKQGVMVLGWPTRDRAEANLAALTRIGHYARQVLADFEDIEERARDFQELSAAFQRQEILARTAAHDVVNKLSLAHGAFGLLVGDSNLPPEQKQLIDRALDQMTLVQAMLEDLKNPDRPIQPERVPVEAIVEMAAGMMARHLEDTQFEFVLDVPPDLPDVWGERIGVLRVLDNLLTNAVRHNADDPHVRVWLRARCAGGCIEFEVGDNGMGISEEAQPHLFEFGFRADSTGKVKGHGMGLWSCRRIVKAHGGNIWVESQSREGARFYFTLPIAPELLPGQDAFVETPERGMVSRALVLIPG